MSLASEGKLIAPAGQYRVVGVDTFESTTADYLIGDYESRDTAEDKAVKHGTHMNPVYVYDDKGECIFKAGDY